MATVDLSSAGARTRTATHPSGFDGRGPLVPPATRPFRYRRITAAGDLLTGALAVGVTWALGWSTLDVAIAVSAMAVAWPLVLTAKTGRPDRLFGVKNT